MRAVASVFSWLGGIFTAILSLVQVGKGVDTLYYSCGYYGCQTYTTHTNSPGWLWFIVITYCILDLIILIWRQYSVANGKR